MRPKTPPFQPNESKEERERKLRDFILSAAGALAHPGDVIAVLARSPDSPVMRALLSVSNELARLGAGARIILAGGAIAAEDETWNMVFAADFENEIRLTSNPRVLDAHEQIVIGDAAVWYGDTMRRDPWKRDAFAIFQTADATAAGRGRVTFERLWSRAQSIYANAAVEAVVMAAVRSAPVAVADLAATFSAEAAAADPEPEPVHSAPDAVCATFETLEAWQPSTCH